MVSLNSSNNQQHKPSKKMLCGRLVASALSPEVAFSHHFHSFPLICVFKLMYSGSQGVF